MIRKVYIKIKIDLQSLNKSLLYFLVYWQKETDNLIL